MNSNNGNEDSCEEEREPRHDRQKVAKGTEQGVICLPESYKPLLTAEQERDERGGDAADHQPRKEDDHQPQNIPPPPILPPPGSLHVSRVFHVRSDSLLSFDCFDPHLGLLDSCAIELANLFWGHSSQALKLLGQMALTGETNL